MIHSLSLFCYELLGKTAGSGKEIPQICFRVNCRGRTESCGVLFYFSKLQLLRGSETQLQHSRSEQKLMPQEVFFYCYKWFTTVNISLLSCWLLIGCIVFSFVGSVIPAIILTDLHSHNRAVQKQLNNFTHCTFSKVRVLFTYIKPIRFSHQYKIDWFQKFLRTNEPI